MYYINLNVPHDVYRDKIKGDKTKVDYLEKSKVKFLDGVCIGTNGQQTIKTLKFALEILK